MCIRDSSGWDWHAQVLKVHRSSLMQAPGPPGIPVLKRQNSPRERKNSRKFPFGKMLDFARSNIISTQTSNIYLNQLQWYGQFAHANDKIQVFVKSVTLCYRFHVSQNGTTHNKHHLLPCTRIIAPARMTLKPAKNRPVFHCKKWLVNIQITVSNY